MPRRYRPPTRRRKSSKGRIRPETEAPSYQDIAPVASPPRTPAAVSPEGGSQVRHITRDHSYILGELRRIGLIVAFIIAGLVIAAILR